MFKNIENYLKSKQKQINKLDLKPILLKWINSPSEGMKQSLTIIDKQVGELLQMEGGIKKLEQWFLSDDKNFNAITAERYIINYLQSKNNSIFDSLEGNGPDAYYMHDNNIIGIEITTLNKDIVNWIFTERLMQTLDTSDFLHDKELEITYSQKRVQIEFQGKRIYEYIKEVSNTLVEFNNQALSSLEISVERHNKFPGLVKWNCIHDAGFPWFEMVTNDLNENLQSSSKKKQFKKYSRNIVFVGLNHSAPSNGVFPSVFKNHADLKEINKYWTTEMPKLLNVTGICYFFYSLDIESPFYPLKIFWRNEEDKVIFNL